MLTPVLASEADVRNSEQWNSKFDLRFNGALRNVLNGNGWKFQIRPSAQNQNKEPGTPCNAPAGSRQIHYSQAELKDAAAGLAELNALRG